MDHFFVDTEPLLDHLILSFLEGSASPRGGSLEKLREKVSCLTSPATADRFEAFIRSRRGCVLTTPHVLVEVDAHASRVLKERNPELGRFRDHIQRELSRQGIEETFVPMLQFDPAVLGSFGVTDASLVAAAEAMKRTLEGHARGRFDPRVTLIIKDQELRGAAAGRGLRVLHPSQVPGQG